MSWSISGIRIFVIKFANDYTQIIARLQPLNNKTVYHTFGYESVVSKLSCYVIGDTDNAAIKALTRTGTAYTLISDQGSYGDFLVKSANLDRQNIICQTLRPDLPEDAPTYLCDLELYLDE